MNDEEQRVNDINARAVDHLEDWIRQLDDGEVQPDDLLVVTYASLIAAILLGYSPEALLEDAKRAADNINSAYQGAAPNLDDDESDQG